MAPVSPHERALAVLCHGVPVRQLCLGSALHVWWKLYGSGTCLNLVPRVSEPSGWPSVNYFLCSLPKFTELGGTAWTCGHKGLFSLSVCVVARFLSSCLPWFYYLFHVYECFVYIYIWMPFVCLVPLSPETSMCFLGLELQIAMSQLMCAGNWT